MRRIRLCSPDPGIKNNKKNMNKILTIIIPTYNMEKYLRKCLDSLLVSDENMQRLEVLVVNDGSKDSSSLIGHEYEAKYPQTFRVIDKENGNYGSCINRGLKEATGKYVKVLDADDYFDKDVFTEFIDFLKTIDVELIISDSTIVNPIGEFLEKTSFSMTPNDVFSLPNLDENDIKCLYHHNITYAKAIFSQIDYCQTEGISYTDDEWIFFPMLKVNRVTYFRQVLYLYLIGREGQTFDPERLKKEFDSRLIVGRNLVSFYTTHISECSEGTKRYLSVKLYYRLKPLYNFYLVNNLNVNMNPLIEFDRFIFQHHKGVLKIVNSIKNRLGGHYIMKWRDSGYNRNIFVLRIQQMRVNFLKLFGVRFR